MNQFRQNNNLLQCNWQTDIAGRYIIILSPFEKMINNFKYYTITEVPEDQGRGSRHFLIVWRPSVGR